MGVTGIYQSGLYSKNDLLKNFVKITSKDLTKLNNDIHCFSAMKENLNHNNDRKRFSVFMPSDTFNAVERYQETHELSSVNGAINEILDTHLCNCENDSAMYQPFIVPRYLYKGVQQPDQISSPASSPVLIPFCTGYKQYSGDPNYHATLYIQNVGSQPAQDVHLHIEGRKENELDAVMRYALAPGEWQKTIVNLSHNPHLTISGTYVDTRGKVQQLKKEFNFPPGY